MDLCDDAKRLISDYGYGGYNMVPAVIGVPVASPPAPVPRAVRPLSTGLACYSGYSDGDGGGGDGDGTRVEEAVSDDDSKDATAQPPSHAQVAAAVPELGPVTCENFAGELPAGFVPLAFNDNFLVKGMCITT